MDAEALTDAVAQELIYSSAVGAYGLVALTDRGGNVARIRRSSDNAEQDFTAWQVANGPLVNWVGAGNSGYLVRLYNQANPANIAVDTVATQTDTAKQPIVVNAGVLVTSGTRQSPAYSSNGVVSSGATANYLVGDLTANFAQGDVSLIGVGKANGLSTGWNALLFLNKFGANVNGSSSVQQRNLNTTQFGCHNAWVAETGVYVDAGTLARTQKNAVLSMSRAGGTAGNGGTINVRRVDDTGLLASSGTQSWSTSATATPGFTLGVQGSTGSVYCWNGIWQAGIIFNRALTTTEFETIEEWLKTLFV